MSDPIRYTALIADIIDSRAFRGDDRWALQRRLALALADANAGHVGDLASQLVITAGDEFQGLLLHASALPDMIWTIEQALSPVRMRWGIGYGGLDTPVATQAIGMDGPVWHAARDAILRAEHDRMEGGVFEGFGHSEDLILSGLAQLLHAVRHRATARQRALFDRMRCSGSTQAEVALALGVSKQVVSKQLQAASWGAYQGGELAFRAALASFDVPGTPA